MKKRFLEIDAFTLRLIAMAAMLSDHLWATLIPGNNWMTWLGRLAFPIFAFQIVEGYFHTHDLKRYAMRLLVFALISEIPFNLMTGGSIIFPFHQNVMFTFLLAVGCMSLIERARKRDKLWLTVLVSALVTVGGFLVGTLLMVDYFGVGILTVLLFYFCHDQRWGKAGELIGMIGINCVLMGGQVILLPGGLEFPTQGFALLSLIPIWLYHGRQGVHNRYIQYGCYLFYPVHILILSILWLYV